MTQTPAPSAQPPRDKAWSRDEQQKPDRARMAQEPAGAEGAADTPKTATDPASGEPRGDAPAPNQADADLTDGAGKRSR